MQSIESILQAEKNLGRERQLQHLQGADFASNDYLGFAKHPTIRAGLMQAIEHGLPLGASASRLVGGYHEMHFQVESQLCGFFQSEAALMMSSGYLANITLLSALCQDGVIYSDERNHASVIDGIKLAKATVHLFLHNDVNDLEDKMKVETSLRQKYVVVESLYSMDGDLAPMADLIALCDRYEAILIVDEAHATGVFGPLGQGYLRAHRFNAERVVSIHPGGKALGASGAFVLCSGLIQKYLTQMSRSFICSTAPSPLIVYQLGLAVELLRQQPEAGTSLLQRAKRFREKLIRFTCVGNSQSQIIPVTLGSNERVMTIYQALLRQGFHVGAIRYPATKKGEERLRLCMHLDQDAAQTEQLCVLLKDLLQ